MDVMPIRHSYGLNPTLRKPTLPRFRINPAIPIPAAYDLNGFLGPVKDQQTLGACTAFSRTGYAEYLYRKFKNQQPVFSPKFLYYKERERDGTLPQDAGSTGETAFWTFHDVGCCLESSDPYDVSTFNDAPTQAQLDEAAKFKHGSEHTLQTVDEVRHAIASDYPVLIGVSLCESFEDGDWGQSWVMPQPQGDVIGGHEIYIKGYDDNAKFFSVRNSWGSAWGNTGDFWMPYDYLESSLMEARIIHFGKPWG